MAKFERVEVMWDDPLGSSDTWVSPQDLAALEAKPHRTCGYLIPRGVHGMKKKFTVIAGTITGSGHYSDVTVLPTSVIVKIKRLK